MNWYLDQLAISGKVVRTRLKSLAANGVRLIDGNVVLVYSVVSETCLELHSKPFIEIITEFHIQPEPGIKSEIFAADLNLIVGRRWRGNSPRSAIG